MSNRRKPVPKNGGARPSLREQSKQRTRDALIDAAVACFTESGLDAPSLDAICARAGCTRGALYVHFQDRDDLIVAAMQRRRNVTLDAFVERAGSEVSLLESLRFFALAVESGSFPVVGAVRSAELLTAARRSRTVRAAQVQLMQHTVERLRARVLSDQANRSIRPDVDAKGLAELLLVAEAGVELVLDLGYPLDVARATSALAALLSGATQADKRSVRRRRPARS
jgi:AcrR family transcriptional regulator